MAKNSYYTKEERKTTADTLRGLRSARRTQDALGVAKIVMEEVKRDMKREHKLEARRAVL